MWEKLMKWKEVAVLVVATASVFLWLGSAKTTAESNSGKIKEQETKMTEQNTILTTLSALVVSNEEARKTMLTMLGIDPEKAKKWSRMAKEPIVNDEGEPVVGVTWVDISENVQLGVAYQFQKDDSGDVIQVVVDTLWDVRKK